MDIAKELNVSHPTVSEHISKAISKLQGKARSQGLLSSLLPWKWNYKAVLNLIVLNRATEVATVLLILGGVGCGGYQSMNYFSGGIMSPQAVVLATDKKQDKSGADKNTEIKKKFIGKWSGTYTYGKISVKNDIFEIKDDGVEGSKEFKITIHKTFCNPNSVIGKLESDNVVVVSGQKLGGMKGYARFTILKDGKIKYEQGYSSSKLVAGGTYTIVQDDITDAEKEKVKQAVLKLYTIVPSLIESKDIAKVTTAKIYKVKITRERRYGEEIMTLVMDGDNVITLERTTTNMELPGVKKLFNKKFVVKTKEDAEVVQKVLDVLYPMSTFGKNKDKKDMYQEGKTWVFVRGAFFKDVKGFIFTVDDVGQITKIDYSLGIKVKK